MVTTLARQEQSDFAKIDVCVHLSDIGNVINVTREFFRPMVESSSQGRTQRYGFLLTEEYALMSAASAVEPLRAANLLSGRRLYDMRFISDRGGWARSSVSGAFDTVPLSIAGSDFDILFVVAGGDPLNYRNDRIFGWLRRLARANVPLGGISGGPALLAAAGVMSSRRFTVHWQHLDAMREMYPDALIERRLFVIDRNRFTCAGGSAPLDMAHALIASDHGVELARAVSDWFIHTGIRMAEAPQQLDPVRRYNLHHPTLNAAIELMANHIADPLNLDDLAKLSGIGARQLERLVRLQLGQSAMQFYRTLRLEKANAILLQSNLSLTEVALATGFSNRSHFSRAFRSHFGISPADRRRRHRTTEVMSS